MKNILLHFCVTTSLLMTSVCYAQDYHANTFQHTVDNTNTFEQEGDSNISSLSVILVNTEKQFAKNISTDTLAHYISDIFISINKNLGESQTDNNFMMEVTISKNVPTYRMAYKNKLTKLETEQINKMIEEIKTIKNVTTKDTLKFNIIFSVEAKKPNFI